MDNYRKKPDADLRKYYTLFLQAGMIIILLIFIVAMKIEIRPDQQKIDYSKEQEVVQMKEVIQTEQEKVPPPPPAPAVPVAVPNDEIIKDEILDISVDFDIDQRLELPPPPQEKSSEESFFVAVQQMPKMVGGQKWLYNQTEYPERARRAGIEGRVIIQFIVNKKGEVENAKVIRGIGGGCDKAALKVIKKAQFTVGRQRGRPVRVQMSQAIFFRLQN
ncbi:MAG TPA: energy transducer TonB [Balneolaceae bacterium]